MTLPPWIKQKAQVESVARMRELLGSLQLNTVCESAHCPNIGDCFAKGTATVMIMGGRCTRRCGFCAVEKGEPWPLDPEEPESVARLVKALSLKHVVVTSVTRDDLPDGGAGPFARTIQAIKNSCPAVTIEVLIPDFQGKESSLKRVAAAKPDVINHNLETVPRLYKTVRPQADYPRSLKVLERARELNPAGYTKSGIMVGLGEKRKEVLALMVDLRGVGCDILTIGQYLRPSPGHLPVVEFIEPQVFSEYKELGEEKGFLYVASAPLVRSSYQAEKFFATGE